MSSRSSPSSFSREFPSSFWKRRDRVSGAGAAGAAGAAGGGGAEGRSCRFGMEHSSVSWFVPAHVNAPTAFGVY